MKIAKLIDRTNTDTIRDLQRYGAVLDERLRQYLYDQVTELPDSLPQAGRMIMHLKEFCLRGGKRLRPYLTRCGYRLFGGRDASLILEAALVPELVHAFLLIHDDIIDQDDERRGGPTMHKIYEQELGSGHLGNSMAILAGDLAYTFALRALSSLPIKAGTKTRISQVVNNAVTHTIYGQDLDLRAEQANEKNIATELIALHKTAHYSFKMPLAIGAILAGANDTDVKALSGYAIPCGIAFQLTDDHLDGKERPNELAAASGYIRQAKQFLRQLPGSDTTKAELATIADFILQRKL